MTFIDDARRMGYEITGPPIRGGTGLIHRATETATGNEVAIKALAPGLDFARLEREATILAGIDHPNVASLRGFEVINGTPALIVDWVNGEPLTNVLRLGSHLPLKRSLDIFEQVANALDAVHRAGVVHRDVSPSNIMIGPDDRITVIDFGISRGTDTATVTIDGTVTGTPRYLAPEVIEGAAATAKSDQYALGVLLHEMLTGSWPYPNTGSVGGALYHQLHSTPRPLDEVNPLLGAGLTDAVLTALEKTPEERFPTIQGFVAAVRNPEAQALRKRSTGLDRPVFTLGVPLIVAAILGLVLFLTLRGGGEEPEPDQDQSSLTPESTESAGVTDGSTASTAPAVITSAAVVATVETWQAGVGDGLACNLLSVSGFESPDLPTNYFGDGTDPSRVMAAVQPTGGVDGTGALLVGMGEGYGLWGQEVPITGGTSYLFSANVALQGEVFTSEMSVYWLDENFDQLAESAVLDIIELGDGQRTLRTDPAPIGAAYAVPRLYVDQSAGNLVADEVVFAPVGAGCDQLLLGS
ncbi:MAG: serine/threonine-protein kinase [Actinomycetota bacterium]